jgi:hypothetical protein
MRPTALTALALVAGLLGALGPAAARAGAAPDYGNPAAWVCRPGAETACTSELDAMVVTADGARTFQAFQPAADAPIDCFYVYPTVSHETTDYADMQASPEVVRTVHDQAGRLTARCRLYAPIYRQLTSAGLARQMAGDGGRKLDFEAPLRDVTAAWRWYLANANHGRGVVLVGHSQGSIILQRLIASEIDGRPAQARLVAAFLAGDPALPVPRGARVGGVFKSIPLCQAPAHLGCVYVWGDYAADDASAPKVFGADPGGGMQAGCEDPAAPSGGSGPLKSYLRRPAMAPEGDPPWVEAVGQLSVACVDDGRNDIARVTVLPGRYADLFSTAFAASGRSGWGLHPRDIGLTQGNILDRLADESAAWTARSAKAPPRGR